MGMSEFYGESDPQAARAVLNRALELGVTFLDTADMYGRGENERLVGDFVREHRQAVTVATKCGIVRGATAAEQRRDTRPEYIRAACDASLARLGVETIDLYYLHRLDGDTPVEDSVGELSRLVQQGKIRHIGLSEVSIAELRRAHGAHPVAAVQSEYSLSTRGGEVEAVIDGCSELGALFVPFSPLGRGLLTGAYRGPADFEGADFRTILPRFQPGALEHNLAAVDRLAALAEAKGCSAAQLALAWVLARGPHVVPIPGTRRLSRLEENVGALDLRLTAAETAAIDQAIPAEAVVGERYPVRV
jgi:aryl-alcohol dehydrogenase-like predicted oxidoreductase